MFFVFVKTLKYTGKRKKENRPGLGTEVKLNLLVGYYMTVLFLIRI